MNLMLHERFVFHTRKQEEPESIEAFIIALGDANKKKCDLCDSCVSSILRDQIVLAIRNPQTQVELLKVRELEL